MNLGLTKTFMNWYLDVVKNNYARTFNYRGRTGRQEFWMFVLFVFVVFVLILPLISPSSLAGFLLLVQFIPLFAASVRRLQDIGWSPGWMIVALVPYVGWLFLIGLFAKRGEVGQEKHRRFVAVTSRLEAKASPSACPYCGVVLDPPPKGSRKCPDCRARIVLRTDPDSKVKVLLTEGGADEFDRKKKVRSDRNRVIRELLSTPALELDGGDYLKEEQRLAEMFNCKPSPGDVFSGLTNGKLNQLFPDPEKNAHLIHMIYFMMGLRALRESRSREAVQRLQREGHRWKLMDYQMSAHHFGGTPGRGAVISTNPCCETCSALEGANYTHEKALDEMPLPQSTCEKDWCTCMWERYLPDADWTPDLRS